MAHPFTFYVREYSSRTMSLLDSNIVSAFWKACEALQPQRNEAVLWLPRFTSLPTSSAFQVPTIAGTHRSLVSIDTNPEGMKARDSQRARREITLNVLLRQAEDWRNTYLQGHTTEAMAYYTLLLLKSLREIMSEDDLEQVRLHLLSTSGVIRPITIPEFEIAQEHCLYLQNTFVFPYSQRIFELFLCILTYMCLAFPFANGKARIVSSSNILARQCQFYIDNQKNG